MKLKNLNRLVQALFYQHKDSTADPKDFKDGIFYKVPYIAQQHANLCTDASMNMLYKAGEKPVASLSSNPRGAFEGRDYEGLKDFKREQIILSFPNENQTKRVARIKEEFIKVLTNNGPFIMDIGLRYGGRHSILVTGISHDRIVFNDPLTGANRTLTVGEISSIHGKRSSPFIEIATPNFLTPEQKVRMKTSSMPENVEIVEDKKYKKHFTLEKMENPCDALREFLQDAVTRGKCTDEERVKLTELLDNHRTTTSIVSIISDLNKLFPNDATTSEKLFKRIQSAIHYVNAPGNNSELKDISDPGKGAELLLVEATIPAISARHGASDSNAMKGSLILVIEDNKEATAVATDEAESTLSPQPNP